jgi:hypothetical protein
MYDPTIFENLKVSFENHVYDLHNVIPKINITNRVDRMDLSVMARDFAIQFTLVDQQDVTAEIVLEASIEDLSAEILETPGKNPGCTLVLRFNKRIQNVTGQCKKIEQALTEIWESDVQLTQTLSFLYGQEASRYVNTIEVAFTHKINEKHMDDIEDFLEHVLETLEVLNDI